MKKVLSLILALTMLLALCGCSAANKGMSMESADVYYDGVYNSMEAPDKYYYAENSDSVESIKETTASSSAAVQNQKLIRTMTLDVETDDLDALVALLDSKIAGLGGYIEDKTVRSSGSYRYANLTVRIPANQLDAFVEHISGASNILSHTESADDVTLSYVATQSRITALETEQTRLLELMAKAESMKDLLLIQERLTSVRTELEEVTSRLRLYDNLVDYGTVKLSVSEVKEYTVVEEETVWQRISNGFTGSMKNLGTILTNLFVFFVVCIPYLLIPGAIILTVIIIYNISRRRKKNTPPPKTETNT